MKRQIETYQQVLHWNASNQSESEILAREMLDNRPIQE